MTSRDRWTWAAAIGFPVIAMTAYLLWVWPRPGGNSVIAETGPYVLSLLTGRGRWRRRLVPTRTRCSSI